MSVHGDVPVEEIDRLTGHSDIRTTETIRTGAGVLDRLLGEAKALSGPGLVERIGNSR
jgi:hypothetical protein